jgi:hypothetical protein
MFSATQGKHSVISDCFCCPVNFSLEICLDIAVDGLCFNFFDSVSMIYVVLGWALTLLSQDSLSYASTCQTIGLNTGFFASFTVFLALNSEAFAEKWGIPRLTLGTYLKFWTIICYGVTLWLLFFKKEVR